jgi:hypothetical protein
MLWIGTAIVGATAAILGLFWILQQISDHTYRPSPNDVRQILQASLEGRLDWKALDEFSCVRIAYDRRLDRLRERYNAILDDPASLLDKATDSNATPLSEQGLARVGELINELDALVQPGR